MFTGIGECRDLDHFVEFCARMADANARFVKLSDSISTRNARAASIVGDTSAFSISYPDDVGNFRNGRVYVTVSDIANDTNVVIQDGKIIQTGTPTDGEWTIILDAGDYQVMTMSAYRSAQIDDAMSPLYAAIPVIVGLAVIGSLIMMVGRLRA